MCLIRFDEPYKTDLLFTLNVPDKHTDDEHDEAKVGEGEAYKAFLEKTNEQFRTMIASFGASEQGLKTLLGM
jgi:hypothetical protein